MNSAATSATDTQADELLRPPRKKGRRQRWLWLVVIVMAGAGTYYYQSSREPEAVNQPLLVTAALGDIENTISSAGSLKPSVFVDVGAQVSGQLQQLHVDVGDKVVAGQLLAEIDARTQVSRVEASRAALAGLESQISSRGATLDLARANAQRQQRLMAAQAASQQDYDTAITNLANAEANLAQLEQQIAQSRSTLSSEETQLEFTRIYAPITGTVVSIEMNEGRTLNANQQAPTILRIADLSVMTVETDISEADIGNLSVGMEIYFTTLSGGSRRWFGKLRQILPTPVIQNNVVLYTGLFDVDNTDASLLPEMTAQVFFITSAARDVLTVPVGALTFMDANGAAPPAGRPSGVAPAGARPAGVRPGGGRPPRAGSGEGRETVPRMATLRVLGADGSEQVREVVIGTTSRVSAEVISGVQAGEQVIAGIIQEAASPQAAQTSRPPGSFIPGGFR